jgi:hypothetical protein
MVGPGRSWPSPADGWPAMPLQGTRSSGPDRGNVATETPKGRTFRKRHRAQPECNNGIRNWGLGIRTFNKTRPQSKYSGRLLECGEWVWGHCGGVCPHPNGRKDYWQLKTRDMGAPATLCRSFHPVVVSAYAYRWMPIGRLVKGQESYICLWVRCICRPWGDTRIRVFTKNGKSFTYSHRQAKACTRVCVPG